MVSKKRSVKLRESGNLEDLSRESRAVGEGLVFRVWPWYQFICEKTTPRPGEGCGSPHGCEPAYMLHLQPAAHPVEKHHINEDPADNAWNNLAVVCRNCHGLVTQKGNLGARYSQGEVLLCKLRWEKRCAEAPVDEIESPLDELHETRLIDGDTHAEYPSDMKRSQELVFSIEANDALDLVICREEDIDAWLRKSMTTRMRRRVAMTTMRIWTVKTTMTKNAHCRMGSGPTRG